MIDTTTDTVLPSIGVSYEPNGSIASGNKLYVFGGGGQTSVIDTTTDSVVTDIPVGSYRAK